MADDRDIVTPHDDIRLVTRKIVIKPGQATLINLVNHDGEIIVGDTILAFEEEGPFMMMPAHLWSRTVAKAIAYEELKRGAQDRSN